MRAGLGIGLLVVGAVAGAAGWGYYTNSLPASLASLTSGVGIETAAEQHPDFSGTFHLRPGTQIRIEAGSADYANDPAGLYTLTQAGQAAYERNKAGVEASDPEIDTALKCQPLGIPRLLYPGPIVFQIMQTNDVIGIYGEWLGPTRMIWFGDQHREGYYPTYMGDSIAHWEGKTLVVDTTNFRDSTFLDGDGFPHSDAMHIVERWTLSDDKNTIANQVTFEDMKYLEAPFTRTYFYERFADFKPTENICENTRLVP